ncbi:MAG TPA: metallopeptidase TldD-related protein [Verrucomicrobiae bacterium]|nr:metallopeptidase TldD-related protein [Verrucomicrobiae bacterium]
MDGHDVVEATLAAGATIAIAATTSAANCRWANNSLTTNGVERALSCTAIAVEGGAVGSEGLDVTALDDCRRAAEWARAAARQAPPAADAFALLGPADAPAHPAPAAGPAGAESLRPLVDPLAAVLERARRDELCCFGYAEVQAATEQLGLTTGLRAGGRRVAGTVSMTVKSKDLRRSAWVGAVAADLGRIDLAGLYDRAAARLAWAQRQVELPAGRYQVILEPSATADLILRLVWEMHARGADEGKTAFAGPIGPRVGERLYAREVSLRGDPGADGMETPAFVRATASSEYSSIFDNGLAVAPTTWVDAGVQQPLMCPRAWARDHGHPVRPPTDNLLMDGDGPELAAMIESTERALLVTSLWYIREVDPTTMLLTGLTRDGVFLVEHGEVVGAVNNFRFNESPMGVLARTLEVGRGEPTISREVGGDVLISAPPIRVQDFCFSSVSDAV